MKKGIYYNSVTNTFIFILAIIIISISVIYTIRFAVKPHTGLVVNAPETIFKDNKIYFAPRSVFSLGVKSGLIPYRDQIIRINNKEINNSLDILQFDYSINTFEPIIVSVIRDETELKKIIINPVFSLTRPDIYITFIFLLALSFTSLLILFRKPHDLSLRFIFFACLLYMIFICVKPFNYENILSNIFIHSGKITAWLFVFFAFYFPKPLFSKTSRKLFIICILILYAIITILQIIILENWLHTRIESYYSDYKFLEKIGHILDLIAYAIYISLIFYSYAKTKLKQEKSSIEWLFAGFFLSIPFYFLFCQLPAIFDNAKYIWFSFHPFSSLILLLFMFFLILGLVKKKLLIINPYILNIIIHAVVLLLILFFFSLFYLPGIRYLENNYEINTKASGFIVTFFFYVLLFPVRSVIIQFLKYIYFKIINKQYVSFGSLVRKNKELLISLEDLKLNSNKIYMHRKHKEIAIILKNVINNLKQPVKDVATNLNYINSVIGKDIKAIDNLAVKEIKETASALVRNNISINKVINELNCFLKIRIPAPVIINPSTLLKNAVLKCRSDLNTLRINMQLADHTEIYTEPNDFIDAVVNIIKNAFEADRSSEIIIRTMLEKNKYRINILNNCSFSGKSYTDKIFEPFFAINNNKNGFGLYLSKLLIERNNGLIYLEKYKEGVKFKILFETV